MSDWSMEELADWDRRICEISKANGLNWYEIS